jgi:hypothetical protein
MKYKDKKVIIHYETELLYLVSFIGSKALFSILKVIPLLLLLSCSEEVKPIKEPVYESGEAKQLYPWNCTDAEIEYYESLIELKDEKEIIHN